LRLAGPVILNIFFTPTGDVELEHVKIQIAVATQDQLQMDVFMADVSIVYLTSVTLMKCRLMGVWLEDGDNECVLCILKTTCLILWFCRHM
jgi:hypothetical protein